MIVAEKESIRTSVEQLYLSEMVDADSEFLIVDRDGDDDDMVIDNTSDSLFDNEEPIYDDDEEDDDYDDIEII